MKYTKENWIAENKVRLMGCMIACPDCGVTEFYSPREANGPKGKETRKYRACKFCGFWQEVGGEPYWCDMYYHGCFKKTGDPGREVWDWKPSWVREYKCENCGDTVSKKVRWPVDDPKHSFHEIRRRLARARTNL